MKQINLFELVITTLYHRRPLYDPRGWITKENLREGAKQICEDIFASLCWIAEQSTCSDIIIYLLEKHVKAWECRNYQCHEGS